jgi:hypothetical protein
MEDLVADGAVNVAFFFRPDNGAQAGFQLIFHKNSF